MQDQKPLTEGQKLVAFMDRMMGCSDTTVRYRHALELIAKTGCMQSKEEEEFFCKHDGSRHSIYCPAGIAIRALGGE